MRLCAYRVKQGMKAGLWVEPESGVDMVQIVKAVRMAFNEECALLLEWEPWD